MCWVGEGDFPKNKTKINNNNNNNNDKDALERQKVSESSVKPRH